MLWIFKSIFFFFTPYVNGYEWKVNRFCNWMTSYRSKSEVEKRLTNLMQENLVITSIWLEKRYKNYRYLTKSTRRRLYKNAELMMADFKKTLDGTEDQKAYIQKIMNYFSPARGKYTYKEGVSFGKLLANPETEQFTGDCNQIVTLYSAFFAQKFPINELQIKLIPGHVCLRFRDDDIEATSATWKKYDTYDYVAPITELVSTNLLDVSEADERTDGIDPEVFVKGAQLAAILSQKREIVENNMRVAYHNLCVRALHSKDLAKAYFYAQKLGDQKLLNSCYATDYNMLAEKVRTVKTVQEAKTKKDTYKRMIDLARKMGSSENAASVQKILDQINKS